MTVPYDFKKLTGPIEHWVTTFHHGYWGFRPDKKDDWEDITEGDVFVFHASQTEFLDEAPRGSLTDIDTGIIGLGRVGAKSTKTDAVWWQEIHQDGAYPYLIHFAEVHWFGDTEDIRDVPVDQKDVEEMVNDVAALAANIITFGEMRERTGYRIPAQGSPANIKQAEKLFPLLAERLSDTASLRTTEADGSESDDESDTASGAGGTVRSRNRQRNYEASASGSQQVTYQQSVGQTITGTIDHEETLDSFEDYLTDHGFEGGETEHSDLIMHSDEQIILGEAKSIHPDNERYQIRSAIGQLLEYRARDIEGHPDRESRELTMCLILSQEPTSEYRAIIESLADDEIFTYWIDGDDIDGPTTSMDHLRTITA